MQKDRLEKTKENQEDGQVSLIPVWGIKKKKSRIYFGSTKTDLQPLIEILFLSKGHPPKNVLPSDGISNPLSHPDHEL